MPQMAPLSWTFLFIFFTLIFFMINSMNYFTFMYEIFNKSSHNKTYKKTNWKW